MQGSTQQKKHATKDGKKSQTPQFTDAECDVANAQGAFEEGLFKRLRNQRKKLREIEDLEEKMKDKSYVAKDAQKEKVASKSKLEAEIAEIMTSVGSYIDQKRQLEKKQKKEMDAAKRQAVRAIASMLCLQTILQKGSSLPGDDGGQVAEGVEHFTKCMNSFINKEGGSY